MKEHWGGMRESSALGPVLPVSAETPCFPMEWLVTGAAINRATPSPLPSRRSHWSPSSSGIPRLVCRLTRTPHRAHTLNNGDLEGTKVNLHGKALLLTKICPRSITIPFFFFLPKLESKVNRSWSSIMRAPDWKGFTRKAKHI